MRVLRRAVSRGPVVLGVLVGALVCSSAPALAEPAGSCPNAAFRTGLSANLPDCRAYELVNPGTQETGPFAGADYAFADGEHVYMNQILPLPGARNGVLSAQVYLSTRGSAGWTMASLSTPQGPSSPKAVNFLNNGGELAEPSFTSDFSAAFVNSPFATDPLDQNLGMDVYRVGVPGGASSLESLPDTGPMTEALVGGGAQGLPGAYVAGSSADGSHVFFETTAQLPTAPGTPVDTPAAGEEVYDRTGGHTYLVGVLPDGSVPACGAEIGQGPKAFSGGAFFSYGAVSPDGSSVVFNSGCNDLNDDNPDTLYLRENNTKTVVLPGLYFGGRTADGSKIFTLGDVPFDQGYGPLYEYDIATGQTTTIGAGELLGSSADGSHVYYHSGSAGGIYLWDDGVTTLISGTNRLLPAELMGGIYPDGYPGNAGGAINDGIVTPSRLTDMPAVTPDGSRMVFVDYTNVTSYDSHSHSEVYLYDADTNSVTCISCNPNAIAESEQSGASISLAQYHPYDPFVPPGVPVVSSDGSHVFFETGEALVPQDTNGLMDVYEWDEGHISLLSSGQGSLASFLVGVGDNGNDVFIRTADRLLGQVEDNIAHIYDARVDGGFPYTSPRYGCESGECQGSPSAPPVFAAPGSSVFSGPGNPPPLPTVTSSTPKGKAKKIVRCAKGKKLSHGKCVKVKAKKNAKAGARNARSDKGGK